MGAAIRITRVDLDAAGLRRAARGASDAARRGACWRWRWCWKASRGRRRRMLREWTGRRCEIGCIATTKRDCRTGTAILAQAPSFARTGGKSGAMGPCRPRSGRSSRRTLAPGRSRPRDQGRVRHRYGTAHGEHVAAAARLPAPRDQRYAWAYLFGAICPARGTGAALVLPFANAGMMNLHLLEISANVTPGAHAVLIVDGARWHQTDDKLRVPDNITLLHLPPYSPELNPVENVWAYLRSNNLSNRVFDTYDAIVDACCDAGSMRKLGVMPPSVRPSTSESHWPTCHQGYGRGVAQADAPLWASTASVASLRSALRRPG